MGDNKNNKMKSTTNGGTSSTIKINDKFTLTQGESHENETFRVLIPGPSGGNGKSKRRSRKKNSDGSSSDDDDDSTNSNSSSSSDEDDKDNNDKVKDNTRQFMLHPSSKRFTRHFNVNSALIPKRTEMELAPLIGPKPVDDTLRHAYSSIQQRTGMKRRWMPLGVADNKAKEISEKLMEQVSTKNTTKITATIPCAVGDDSNNDIKHSTGNGSNTSSRKSNSVNSINRKKKRRMAVDRDDDDRNGITTPSPKTKRMKTKHNNNNNKNDDNIRTPSLTSSQTKEERKAQKKAAKKEAKKSAKKAKKQKMKARSY